MILSALEDNTQKSKVILGTIDVKDAFLMAGATISNGGDAFGQEVLGSKEPTRATLGC